MLADKELHEVDAIVVGYGGRKSALIAIMQDIQSKYRYLPKEVLLYLAKRLDLSEAKVYSVATFYENFSLEPKGENLIKVCDGTACHVKHSIPILNAIRNSLKLPDGQNTTDDGRFTVETVACLGACGLSPVITINDRVHAAMTPDSAVALIDGLRAEG